MKSRIFIFIGMGLFSGLFSAPAQSPQKPTLFLSNANSTQEKADKLSTSSVPVNVLKVWKINRFLYRNLQHKAGEVPPDEMPIQPADKHFFIAIELAFPKGETIVRTEPVTKRSPGGELSIIDLVYTGSLGHRVPVTSASVSDASGDHYLPLASVCGTGVYLVQPLGGIKASIFAPGMTDIGFPDDVGFAESGRFVLLYEIPIKRSGFKLKVADGEPIAIPVKT